MNTISLVNIDKIIKNSKILKKVNVSFSSPGIYGIIGRNGAGKSVMLKVLMRLYSQSEGKVLFNNMEVDKFEDFPFVIRGFLEVPRFLSKHPHLLDKLHHID
jgi:ABC-2 type transport system ATP-binding protein